MTTNVTPLASPSAARALTVSANELPGPEEITEHEIDGFYVLVENRNPRLGEQEPSADEPPQPRSADEPVWRFGVARAPGASRVHAVRVRTDGRRLVPNTWTLCSEQGMSKRARGEQLGQPLTMVTCQHCVGRLQREREL